ncbi:MAG TPA: methylated-DNA--[protein]-cysteine S-methyltransferase [Prolixibacteraceae bacterium]|nr:methylated-DNA--[protein]-cysteine S-methyltransferase [Prolixibacteraceae bacterium]
MNHIHIQYFKTGIGELILGSFEGQLCMLDYRYRKMRQSVDERIRKGVEAELKFLAAEPLRNPVPSGTSIWRCSFSPSRLKEGMRPPEFIEQNDEVLSQARRQLEEYLSGNRTRFDLPLLMVGTGFQKAVWTALAEVPYGKTATYLDLAKSLGNEKAVRAVAAANGANALAIVIPCHRIVGSRGELTGYSGGLAVKQRLLQLEQGSRTLFENSYL